MTGRLVGIIESGADALSSIALERDPGSNVTAAPKGIRLQEFLRQRVSACSPMTQPARSLEACTMVKAGRFRVMVETMCGTLPHVWFSYESAKGTASFTYNAFGTRVSRTSAGVTRQYVWNFALDLPSLSVIREDSADQRYFVYLPDGTLHYSIDANTGAR